MMTFTDMNFNSLDIVDSSMQRRFTSGKDSLTAIIFIFDYWHAQKTEVSTIHNDYYINIEKYTYIG